MLEHKTTSLALSKRMKELGAVQESERIWISHIWREQKEYNLMSASNEEGRMNLIASGYDIIPAFDASELGEMLPPNYEISRNRIGFWFCQKQNDEDEVMQGQPTMAEAMGEMVVYLLENKLLKL